MIKDSVMFWRLCLFRKENLPMYLKNHTHTQLNRLTSVSNELRVNPIINFQSILLTYGLTLLDLTHTSLGGIYVLSSLGNFFSKPHVISSARLEVSWFTHVCVFPHVRLLLKKNSS